MYYIFNSIPFELYIVILIGGFFFLLYGIYDMHKNKPGHPMIWMLPFAMITDIALIVYRCTVELTTNLYFQKISDACVIISIVLFILSFIITFILASKNNYTNKAMEKKAISTLKSCAVSFIICMILIALIYFLW